MKHQAMHPRYADCAQAAASADVELRTVPLGAGRLAATPIPAGSYLVRVHPDGGPQYDRMIVVTPEQDGAVLHLSGWIGTPLTPSEWQAARQAIFPAASHVRFERMRADGTLSHRELPIAI
jgi:hypothetical protein